MAEDRRTRNIQWSEIKQVDKDKKNGKPGSRLNSPTPNNGET